MVLLLAIALGVGLRGEGLGRRPLWYDEVATSLRISGSTEADVELLHDGRLHAAGELLRRFQRTGDEPLTQGVARVARSVAVDEPQLAPGYFVAAYLWARGFGNDRARLRALSAAASIAALALLGALAWRLFQDRGSALAAMALAAVSPLQIRYAQEARAYALWSALLLLTALALLGARQHASRMRWTLVALAFATALYVHPLSLLVVPSLLLLAAPSGAGATRATRNATLAAVAALAAALVLWAPWALVILDNRDASLRTTSWSGEHLAAVSLLRSWLGVATSVFFRPGGAGGLLDGATSAWSGAAWAALGAGAAVLIACALASVARNAGPAARGFVATLALVPFATLALADVALGGRRSTVDRYLLPAWLALELAVAFFLASPGPWRRTRHAVLVLVLVLGAATVLRTRPLDVWWNTDPTGLAQLRAIETRLAGGSDAIVLSDASPLRTLELAHRLEPATGMRLGADGPAHTQAGDWARVVLVQPSPELLERSRQLLPPDRELVPDLGGLPLLHAPERR